MLPPVSFLASRDSLKGSRTGLGIWGSRLHLDLPRAVVNAISHLGLHVADHPLRRVRLIKDRECDRSFGHILNVPESVRPVVGTTVECVVAVIGLGMKRLIPNTVLCITDSVYITTWDGVVDGMSRVIRCGIAGLAWNADMKRVAMVIR